MSSPIPSLIGVVHLLPLPGSPRYEGDIGAVAASAGRCAQALADAGFDGIVVENYGDAPFEPKAVSPATVAALTRCAIAVRIAAPTLALGINVLRNDAEAALGVAVATGASFVRINVHIGARLTDQGIIEGRAHHTLRLREQLGASHLRLLCDVDVKHSAPLAPRPLYDEVRDLVERGGADAVLVTGGGTGREASLRDVDEALRAVDAPVLVASGVAEATLSQLRRAHGVIVGSCLRADGKAGGPIDARLAQRFADAFWASRALDARTTTDPPPPVSV